MIMELQKLLLGVDVLLIKGVVNEVRTIQFDSRQIQKGDLFVATRGTTADGHDYISKALDMGASTVVCEEFPNELDEQVTYVKVVCSTEALGIMAANFYGNPSHHLTLVGVTGTNGKTTVASLLYQLFTQMGYRVGLLSTVCNYVAEQSIIATHTTPDALHINQLLHDMVEAGCQYAFMEVSSHAVDQRRIAGLQFAGGIFTNITRDHLDYHKTFDNYLKAKKRFFDDLPEDAFALTNADDKNGRIMLQNCKATIKTYSVRGMADFKTRILENSFEGMLLDMNGHDISLPFIGKFNAYNLTAVFGAAVLLGYPEGDILCSLSTLEAVSGRFETITSSLGFTSIVDYAHTPDALNNVLSTINDIRNGSNQLITVVGCGGNRDKGKRPMMAKEAVLASDRVILTSDNPRFENPQDIINDMLAGLDVIERRKVLVIVDRREAIKTACALAQSGDVILVAGKGHEDYQIVGDVKHHFDDKEEIRNAISTNN